MGKIVEKFRRNAWEWAYELKEAWYQLLRVDLIRFSVAKLRYVYFVVIRRCLRTFDSSSGDIGVNTVHHNALRLGSFRKLVVKRSNLLVYPLSALRLSRKAPILCIGPRTEGELLNFMGLGFRNVRGLDLISYSPWIDLGDMHALPYADDTFAGTLSSFCLVYSNNRQKVAQEMVRVTRAGGIIGVGDECSSVPVEEVSKGVGYQMPGEDKLKSIQEVLSLFGNHVGHIFFSQDRPDPAPEKYDYMVIFSLKK